jgi:hypothetical protein
VIVDSGHRIVSVVPVGSSGAQLDRDRGSVGVRTGGAMNLSVEEIREVQQVLVREGFDVEVDGRLGPKTRQGLISFQRKSGLQASGQIDTQTVTKLGVNIRGAQGGSGQSTTGQGGSSRDRQDNLPSRDQGQRGRQDQQDGDRNNQRSDQERRDGNAPSNTEGRSDQRSEQDRNNNANAPSTTGQGGQQGGERGNMPSRAQDGNVPKSQQDDSQNRGAPNRDR